MKKIVATIAATGLLLVGGASSASAETLYRNGAKKVTITASTAKVPAGAEVTKARIWVKKGKKTVAKNKKFYKAKKGKYKVTSKVTYRFPATETYVPGVTTTSPAITKTVPVTESDMAFERCTVTGRSIENRTVQATDYDSYWGEATVQGQAVITYTGNCTAEVVSLGYVEHKWTDEWTELVSVFEPWEAMSYDEYLTFDPQAWLENELAKSSSAALSWPELVGNVVFYPGDGTELDKAGSITVTVPGVTTTTPGYWITNPASSTITVTSTRTVRVR